MVEEGTRVKCANCGSKWKYQKSVEKEEEEEDTLMCPDCEFIASVWNFVPELEGQ